MMQADDDDEENGQRDWLDYIYMAVRIFMLLSIFWFYSSPERLIIMGAVIFIVWLIQSGVFNLNRAPRNRQPGKYIVYYFLKVSSLFCVRRFSFISARQCLSTRQQKKKAGQACFYIRHVSVLV